MEKLSRWIQVFTLCAAAFCQTLRSGRHCRKHEFVKQASRPSARAPCWGNYYSDHTTLQIMAIYNYRN